MAKKYIDADRLKQTIADHVYPLQDVFNSRDYGMFWTGGIEKAIDEQPTADVVEVVRCADCKYWDRSVLEHQANDFREWDEAECGMLAERDPYYEVDHYTEEDDFCSRGERKDG